MSELLATVRGSEEAIRSIVNETTLAGKSDYDHAYLNVSDGQMNIISAVPGSSAISYSTFEEGDFLTRIEVSEAVREQTSDDERATTEALIDIDTFLTYFELVSGGDGDIRLEFHGELGGRLASLVEIYGSVGAGLHLPVSDSILERMPLWVPNRFDENNVWRSDNVELETEINTSVQNVQRIIDAVDADEVSGMDNYPVVVEDGEFKLDVTDDNARNWIAGSLDNETGSVAGDDVANLYGKGFKPIFEVLGGDVRLHTENVDGGAPLVVIKEKGEGIIRHMIGPTGSL